MDKPETFLSDENATRDFFHLRMRIGGTLFLEKTSEIVNSLGDLKKERK